MQNFQRLKNAATKIARVLIIDENPQSHKLLAQQNTTTMADKTTLHNTSN